MKILLISPIYHIEGREDLFHDSSAIHYLVSPLAEKNDISVLNTYCASARELVNRVKYANLKRTYRFGYEFDKDGIHVNLIENQFAVKQKFYNHFQKKKIIGEISKEISQATPEVIGVHFPTTYYGVLNKMNITVPVIAVLHKTDINKIKSNRELVDYINSTFRNVYARSDSIRQDANALGINVSNRVIFSGVVSEAAQQTPPEKKEIRNILYVGKLIKRKNVDKLIAAFAKCSAVDDKVNLKIVGDGPEYERLQLMAKDNSNIIFTGSKSREEVFDCMRQSDLFIMPSVNETLGLVYLEAMSAGCITVGTKGEGIDGVIQDNENGFLISPDEESIYECLRRICSLPVEELHRLSKKAFETAICYSTENAAQNYYEALIEEVNC